MSTDTIGPVDKYFYNAEAEQIGGMVVLLLGNPGAGKTVGLAIKGAIDLDQGRIVYWRGQETCQWILLAANNVPVTLWIDSHITEFQPFLSGDIHAGVDAEPIDLEQADGIDVKIKEFDEPADIVENPDTDRVNVFYFAGAKAHSKNDRYHFYKSNTDLASAFNTRDWGDPVSLLIDEVGDVCSTEKQQPFYRLMEYRLPEEFGNFRKNGVSCLMTGHDTSDINYKIWKVKANGIGYMQGAQVKGKDSKGNTGVSQDVVNHLKRGEFVLPGFEKDHFDMPKMPPETIPWIPDDSARKLRIKIESDVPNVLPKDTASEALEDAPVDKEHLIDIVDTTEAAELIGITSRSVRKRIASSSIPAIKVKDKYIMSRQTVEELAE